MAAGPADKPRLNIGQPNVIRPKIAADGDRVAAAVVDAIDKQPANAAFGHLGKGDFLERSGMAYDRAPRAQDGMSS
jgi:hypothetical protein